MRGWGGEVVVRGEMVMGLIKKASAASQKEKQGWPMGTE